MMKNGKPINLDERLTRLEADVREIKAMLAAQQKPKEPSWKDFVGMYENDPAFEEVDRIVRENQEKQRRQARRRRPKAKAKA